MARAPRRGRAFDRSREALFDPIGDGDLGARIAQGRAVTTGAAVASSSRCLFAAQQDPAGPIERVVSSAPMAGLFGLDSASHGVEGRDWPTDDVEGVDHLVRLGQHDRVDRRIGGRHVEGAEADALLPGLGLFVQPAGHIGVFAGGQDVDDLVVLHVGDRRGVVGVAGARELDEGGLVEADGRGLVQPLAVGRQQRLAIGASRRR